MATAVQIELLVDEKGAVQGIRSFDTAIKSTQGTTGQLDATLKQLNATLEKMAASGANAGRGAGRALHQVKEDGLSAREGVHLVTEELDIRMPRAFKNLIANSKTAEIAVKAVGTAIVGIGAIQIGVMIFSSLAEGAHKLWEEHLSLTKAAEDYEQELKKIKQQDFGNTNSIETTRLRIGEATKAAEEYRRQAEAAANYRPGLFSTSTLVNFLVPGGGPLAQMLANRSAAHDLQTKEFDEERQKDKLRAENLIEQGHEQRRAEIELSHAKDEQLTKEQRITAERQKQIELAQEDARYGYERETARGNKAQRPSAFDLTNGTLSQGAIQELQAQGEAEAQLHNLHKEQAQELRRLQEDALEAGLRGVDLYRAQEAFAIEDLKAKDLNSVAARKAVHDKFHAEELMRIREEENELRKLHDQTLAAGLTGTAKIRQEGANRINELSSQNAIDRKMNPGQLLKAENEIGLQTAQQLGQAYQSFSDQVDSILDETTERTVQGFARIHAEAQKQIRDLEKDYREKGGRPADLTRGEAGIRADETSQIGELQRHNTDETARIESEAHARSLSAEKQQTLAIQTEFQQRVSDYQSQLNQQLISEEDFNRRVAAAAEERDAQMVDAARQAREKMAGEFSRFFKDPLGSLKEMGDKAAGEVAAALVQRAQGKFAAPGASSQGTHLPMLPFPGIENWSGGGFSGLTARIAGVPSQTRGQVASHPSLIPSLISPDSAAAPEIHAHRAEAVTPHVFSLANAEIRIGTATINIPAIAQPASSGAGGSSPSRGAIAPLLPGAGFSDVAEGGEVHAGRGGGFVSMGEAGDTLDRARQAFTGSSTTKPGDFINRARRAFTGGGATASANSRSSGGPEFTPRMTGESLTGESLTGGSSAIPGGAIGQSPIGAAAPGGVRSTPSISAGSATVEGSRGATIFSSATGDLTKDIGAFADTSHSITGKPNPAAVLERAQSNANMPDVEHQLINGSFDKNGNFQSLGSMKSSLFGKGGMFGSSGSTLGNLSGAAQGATGLYSAFEGNGGFGGALSGGLSGMETGAKIGSLFGPEGTVVGAAVGAIGGAIMGAIGFGGKEKGRVYDLKTVRPRLGNDFQAYQTGSMDYTSAYSDMQSLDMEARQTLDKAGGSARDYYWDTINKEIKQAEAKLTAEQKAGRSQFTMSAAQYDQGGWLENFGSFATGSDTGFVHGRRGEFVMTEQPAAEHAGALEAIRAGASRSDMASYYGADAYRTAMQSSTGRQSAGSAPVGHTFNVKAWDHRSVVQMLYDHKDHIRGAFNASFAENSGGSDAGF
jgi:hypothetical protein